MPTLRLGTRKSALAQAQARWVANQLKDNNPGLHIEFVLITTSGDSGRPVEEKGGLKALFTKEIEEALLDRRIDVAVHSLKDMAAELPQGLCLAAVPMREDPRDVWIGKKGLRWKDLPPHAKVATGAVRRQAQLRHARLDLEVIPLHGNVDTRLRKLAEGDFDGLILALAGLRRLGREKEVTDILSEEVMLPAIGQGCLAIETRTKDETVLSYVQCVDHPSSHQSALAERAFLKALGGNCQTPIAAYAQVERDRLTMTGLVAAPSGHPYLKANVQGIATQAEVLGQQLGQQLLDQGARKLLETIAHG